MSPHLGLLQHPTAGCPETSQPDQDLFQTQHLGEGPGGEGSRAQTQAHHGLQPFPRSQEVGLAPAESRQTLSSWRQASPKPKEKHLTREGEQLWPQQPSLGAQSQEPGSAHSILPGCPLCHLMSSRVWWVTAATVRQR